MTTFVDQPAVDEAVAAAAESLVGIKFLHQGRSRAGVDCAGVLAVVAREVGASYHDFLYYHEDPDPEVLIECLRRSFPEVPAVDPLVPGRVVAVAQELWRPAKHIGIVVRGGDWVHACALRRKVVREPWTRARERLLRIALRMEVARG